MQFHARRGLMLIEAILTVLVIAFVAGLTTLSLRFAVRRARTYKAREECAMLIAACKTYRAFVNEWPKADSQEDVLAILCAPVVSGYVRGPVLGSLKEMQIDDVGRFVGPWGSPYVIEFPEEGILVYSFGPDMESDEGHFEGDGCAEGVHASLGLRVSVDDVRPVGVHHRDTEAQR